MIAHEKEVGQAGVAMHEYAALSAEGPVGSGRRVQVPQRHRQPSDDGLRGQRGGQ